MDYFIDINWIALLALAVVSLLYVIIYALSKKINWTILVLISLALGIIVGLVFKSNNNTYLKWVTVIGDIYINLISALVAPVILISILSSFITLKNKDNIKSIGLKSILWLMTSALAAVIISILVGTIFRLGHGAKSVFDGIDDVSSGTVSAYSGLAKSFDEVIKNLFPSNIISDLADNNVVAIIIISLALALGYIAVAKSEGEEKLQTFKNLVLSVKKIIYKVLAFVIRLTPYAILAIISSSTSKMFANRSSIIQLLILVGLIYFVAIVHTFLVNGALVRLFGKVNPVKFFKKIIPAQLTAFTTQSSVGTLPVTIKNLKDSGVNDEVSNFTAPLGTTIGMPGCTCIWPILLVIFYINAVGISWGIGDYIILGAIALVLSVGSAGVPGIAVVSSIALFEVLNLPVAAVILLMPINTISDMVRTFDNVSTAAAASIIVARQTNNLNDALFNGETVNEETEVTKENVVLNDDIIPQEDACSFKPKQKTIDEDLIPTEDACSFKPKQKTVDEDLIPTEDACSFKPKPKREDDNK